MDGHKRTATAAMARWLLMEGYGVRSGQDDLVEAAVSIATKLDERGAAQWLQSHSEHVDGRSRRCANTRRTVTTLRDQSDHIASRRTLRDPGRAFVRQAPAGADGAGITPSC